MKVGILTLRFHSNFGFIMQAYAMQQIVKQLGHEPYTYYTKVTEENWFNKVKRIIKNLLLKIFGKYKGPIIPRWLSNSDYDIIDVNTNKFIADNISLTPYFDSIKLLQRYDHSSFGAFIVGSDQVWREEFSLNIPTYFLDFIQHPSKKIAYAASFGVSKIDYSLFQIFKCKKLIKEFSLVSVREKEGVDICKKVFNIEAVQVLDPTMLVDVGRYNELADRSTKTYPSSFLFTYILDDDTHVQDFVGNASRQLGFPVINALEYKKSDIVTPYPSIYDLLKGFRDAEYVITDSFHASVFSILFHKQFCVLKNPYRGISRLTTLLTTFGLSDRITETGIPARVINYSYVDQVLSLKRIDCIKLLNEALNE